MTALPLAPSVLAPSEGTRVGLTVEIIYEREFAFVWRSIRGLGLEGAAVDDAVQDVFLTVHRRLSTFEQRSALRTWLYGIVRHVVLDHRRRWRRKEAHAPLPPRLQSDHPSPDRIADARQALELVQRFLSTLSQNQREVFLLCDVEQIPAPEVATMVGTNVNTVYSRLRRARAAFRAWLATAEGEP